MKEVVDVVIGGAGPAGLMAAIEAVGAGLSVLVLDPRAGVIDKACGEGIMPAGVVMLAERGIHPEGIRFSGVEYVDASDPKLRAAGHFRGSSALGVRRTELHRAMKQRAATCGVRLRQEKVTSFEARRSEVLVNGELVCRWLIGADGLHSQIRRALGVEHPRRGPARLAIRRHFARAPWSDRVEVHFGANAEAYVTPVGPDVVGVAILFEAEAEEMTSARHYGRLLEQFPALARRLEGCGAASTVRGAGPFEQRVDRRVVGNVLLVGDAAGYVDPLTGEGIALGLASALAAVRSIVEGAPESYEARWRQLSRRSFAATSALLAITRRARLRKALLRTARAFPVLFDAALARMSELPEAT
jgi:flavin-dependent dehydrogenase